jgi:Ca2+/Na+ antiporter
MAGELKKTYYILLLPSVTGFVLLFFLKTYNAINMETVQFSGYFSSLIFILTAVFAIALPIFYRTLFAHKIRDEKGVSEKDFIKFERGFLFIALIAPYLTLIAYVFDIPRFYAAGSLLMSMYAVYYYYPSKRRISFEKRIFRVR